MYVNSINEKKILRDFLRFYLRLGLLHFICLKTEVIVIKLFELFFKGVEISGAKTEHAP